MRKYSCEVQFFAFTEVKGGNFDVVPRKLSSKRRWGLQAFIFKSDAALRIFASFKFQSIKISDGLIKIEQARPELSCISGCCAMAVRLFKSPGTTCVLFSALTVGIDEFGV